jgi:hypothetical protein
VWLTALIVAASTLLAAIIGAVAALRAAERARQEASRRDVLAALGEYLGAASTVVGELSGLPAVPRVRAINKLAEGSSLCGMAGVLGQNSKGAAVSGNTLATDRPRRRSVSSTRCHVFAWFWRTRDSRAFRSGSSGTWRHLRQPKKADVRAHDPTQHEQEVTTMELEIVLRVPTEGATLQIPTRERVFQDGIAGPPAHSC